MVEFTHIKEGNVRMVDIGGKRAVVREAVATGRINLRAETIQAIREGTVTKGNVLATARIAATLAVKDTPGIIPLCHTIPISSVIVDLDVLDTCIQATVRVTSEGKTGVEMEALTGTTVALLTVWDMVKSAEKDASGQYPSTSIEGIRVIEKRKGS